jgi:hypothetical protein
LCIHDLPFHPNDWRGRILRQIDVEQRKVIDANVDERESVLTECLEGPGNATIDRVTTDASDEDSDGAHAMGPGHMVTVERES